jgi:alpha-mannosidase
LQEASPERKTGYGSHFSLLSVSDPNVLLWSVKPSEEGIENGIITRFWNFKNENIQPIIKFNISVYEAWETTHIETNKNMVNHKKNSITPSFSQNQIKTFRFLSLMPDN